MSTAGLMNGIVVDKGPEIDKASVESMEEWLREQFEAVVRDSTPCSHQLRLRKILRGCHHRASCLAGVVASGGNSSDTIGYSFSRMAFPMLNFLSLKSRASFSRVSSAAS